MTARHQMICEDRRKVSNHGKDIGDGEGATVSKMVRNCINHDYGPGSLNIVRQLAMKHPFPNKEHCTRYFGFRGIYATTRYIYMFLDHNSIDEAVVAVDSGYSGSSTTTFQLDGQKLHQDCFAVSVLADAVPVSKLKTTVP